MVHVASYLDLSGLCDMVSVAPPHHTTWCAANVPGAAVENKPGGRTVCTNSTHCHSLMLYINRRWCKSATLEWHECYRFVSMTWTVIRRMCNIPADFRVTDPCLSSETALLRIQIYTKSDIFLSIGPFGLTRHICSIELAWLGVMAQVQGVNMLGAKASHFLVYLAVLGVASHVTVSIGE